MTVEALKDAQAIASGEVRLTLVKVYMILIAVYKAVSNGISDEEYAIMEKAFDTYNKSAGGKRGYSMKHHRSKYYKALRYVFLQHADQKNIYRYAGVLEYASQNNVIPDDLRKFVQKCGGMVECYYLWGDHKDVYYTRNKLTLNGPIKYKLDIPILLEIIPKANSTFQVLSMYQDEK
jgi:hypothetical protein